MGGVVKSVVKAVSSVAKVIRVGNFLSAFLIVSWITI